MPVNIIWQINKPGKGITAVINEVDEQTLSKNISQAKDDDINQKVTKEYRRRRGQKKFSDNLFIVCKGKCCTTGTTVKSVLHACHIIPHAESGNNNTTNGLLLRSDIHDLFDTHQIGIHPKTLKVHIKNQLLNSEYKNLKGKILLSRSNKERPNLEALKKRWNIFKEQPNKVE